jgi:hypothetical protein
MRLALRAALCLSLLAFCSRVMVQAQGVPFSGVRDNARYIVFLHTGGDPPVERISTEKLVRALQARGFTVGRGDDKQDSKGPGVDYFRKEDRPGAEDVADIVNGVLPPSLKRLEPRLQTHVSNPLGFLGVWLYSRSHQP